VLVNASDMPGTPSQTQSAQLLRYRQLIAHTMITRSHRWVIRWNVWCKPRDCCDESESTHLERAMSVTLLASWIAAEIRC
jgi:hypothetical protein